MNSSEAITPGNGEHAPGPFAICHPSWLLIRQERKGISSPLPPLDPLSVFYESDGVTDEQGFRKFDRRCRHRQNEFSAHGASR